MLDIQAGQTVQLSAPPADYTTIEGSGTLDLNGQSLDSTVSLVNFSGTLANSCTSTATIGGDVAGGNFTVLGSGNIAFSGSLTNTALTLAANADMERTAITLEISGTDSGGSIDIEAGTVQLQSTAALEGVAISGSSGAGTLDLNGQSLNSTGWNMAELSGDYDPTTGKVEIWPQLLEEAWAQMNGGYQSIWSGTVASAWMALTGNTTQDASIAGLTNQQIAALIQTDLATGQQVSVATKDIPGAAPVIGLNGQKIYFDHAYIVGRPYTIRIRRRQLSDSASLIPGPPGSDDLSPTPEISISSMSEVLSGVFTLTQ